MFVCIARVFLVPGGQKAADPLELGFQILLSCQMSAGKRIWVLHKQQELLTAEPSLQPLSVSFVEQICGPGR